MKTDTPVRAAPSAAELPESVTRPLAKMGLRAHLTLERLDGSPVTPHELRVCRALIATAGLDEDDGPRAADAFTRAPDGSLTWSPDAQAIVDAEVSRAADRDTKPSKR